MSNPLLAESALPPFNEIQPEHVEPAIFGLIEQNLSEIEKLLDKQQKPTWESLIKPLEELGDRLSRSWSCVSHLNSVANTPQLRRAYHNCLPKLSDYGMKIGQNQRLYEAYVAMKESPEYAQLSLEQKKVIDNALRDFKLSGVALPADKKEHFAALNQELSGLQSQFQDNVLDATDHWHLDVQSVEELAGLPEQSIELAKQTAQKAGSPGWRLTLDYPCYSAVITYADNAELRQKIHCAYNTRASDQSMCSTQWDNTHIMERILAIRHEMANLLGFADFSENSLATKMAKTPEEVLNFLVDLAEKALPFAKKEMTQLSEFALAEYGIKQLAPWDIAYYSEKLRLKNFNLSQEELRAYFPLDNVLKGLFEVVSRLYGLQIVQEKNIPTWHPDVQFYSIFDNHKELRGQFYLDLFSRPHKRGGAWMDEARVRRRRADGSLQVPIAFLTCNFRPPLDGLPSLLTHDEVLTLFHEFGHGIHHLLTKMEYSEISGINGVPWDAVEMPSQFMENWCWQQAALSFISSHYQTQQPLPAEILNKMLAARNFQAAMRLMRQLEFALFDFRLHREFDPRGSSKIAEILADVRKKYTVVPVAPYTRFQHSFSHVFAGGYAAGYYSYLWAEVLSQDAFSRFEEEGIFNSQVGNAFLENILEKGGSEEPEILFKKFRGRAATNTAFLRHHGLV